MNNDNDLRTIRLYGKLGAKFGRVFKLAVSSPAEAVHALSSMIPGFSKYLLNSGHNGMDFAVFVGKSNIDKDQLTTKFDAGDIRIAPVMKGAKKGWAKIIGGAVLWVVGAYVTLNGNVALGEAMMGMGRTLMIGGVTQLLTPMPKINNMDKPENTPSYAFNGPVNTQAQGNPVPIAYGRIMTGSAVISAGITVEDSFVPQPPPVYTGNFWRFLADSIKYKQDWGDSAPT